LIQDSKTFDGRGRRVLDRVAVFTAAPVATFLALLLELLLSFGIGETEEKFDASLLVREAVEFLDHSFRNLTCLKSADGQSDRRQEG